MHEEIKSYIEKNIDKHDIELIKEKLLKADHSEEEINDTIYEVLEKKESKEKEDDILLFPDPNLDYSNKKLKVKSPENNINPNNINKLHHKDLDITKNKQRTPQNQNTTISENSLSRSMKYYTHHNLIIFLSILTIIIIITIYFIFLN